MIQIGVGVGAVTGILGVLFNFLVQYLIQAIAAEPGVSFSQRMLIVPLAGGLLLGLIQKYLVKNDQYGFDVFAVVEEIRFINTYIMRPIVAFYKTLATILTLVIGWSAGRQGPIVYIGGAFGSWIGYKFHYKKDEIKILIASGAAGALAGVFNEPIFATIFVLEVILYKNYLTYFAPVSVAAVTATAVTWLFNGDTAFLQLGGPFVLGSERELLWMLLLGAVMGVLAVVYIRTIKLIRQLFSKFRRPVAKGLLAGGLIAGTGYFLPEIFDLHLGVTERIVAGEFPWALLLVMVAAKIILTGVTLSGGGIGGVFLPGLYIGAATGYVFGTALEHIPWITIESPSAYALMGMSGMFSGFANAPLSATLLLMELTGSRELVLPFLIRAVVSSIIAEAIHKDSIYGHTNFVWAPNEDPIPVGGQSKMDK